MLDVGSGPFLGSGHCWEEFGAGVDGVVGVVGVVGDGGDLTADFDVISHNPAYPSPDLAPIQVSSLHLQFAESPFATIDPCLLQLSPSFDLFVDSSENGLSHQNFNAIFDPPDEPPLPLIPNTESHSESNAEGVDIDITDLLVPHTNIGSSCPSSDSPSSAARSASETIRCDFPGCDRVFKDRRRLKYDVLYLLTLP